MATLSRDKDDPWRLKTAPGTAEYAVHVAEMDGIRVLVSSFGKTILHDDARCIADLLPCPRPPAGGSTSGAPTSTSRPRMAASRLGGGRRATRSAAGTGARRVCAGASTAAPHGRARPVRARAQPKNNRMRAR